MRYLIYFLTIFNFISCKNDPDFSSGKVIAFKGKMNSKIPVFLWVIEKQDVIIGEVRYVRASNKGIKLIGNPYNNGYELTEYLSDGTVSGVWRGKIDNNSFLGTWNSGNGSKEYCFEVNKADTLIHVDTSIIDGNYAGQYRYRNGNEGSEGSVLIEKNGDRYSLICANVTSAPARNMADFTIDSLKITNNEFICDLNNDTLCVFRIRFFKDFIIINSIAEKRDCGFGLNAFVDGVYVKTKE